MWVISNPKGVFSHFLEVWTSLNWLIWCLWDSSQSNWSLTHQVVISFGYPLTWSTHCNPLLLLKNWDIIIWALLNFYIFLLFSTNFWEQGTSVSLIMIISLIPSLYKDSSSLSMQMCGHTVSPLIQWGEVWRENLVSLPTIRSTTLPNWVLCAI